MLIATASHYTEYDFNFLSEVIRNGIESVSCNYKCEDCKTKQACDDLWNVMRFARQEVRRSENGTEC